MPSLAVVEELEVNRRARGARALHVGVLGV